MQTRFGYETQQECYRSFFSPTRPGFLSPTGISGYSAEISGFVFTTSVWVTVEANLGLFTKKPSDITIQEVSNWLNRASEQSLTTPHPKQFWLFQSFGVKKG